MPSKPKETALTKRRADSFKLFSNPEFKSGYQQLATLQPLNKSKRMGWFLKEQDLPHCEWTASEEDMEYPEHPKGAVMFGYGIPQVAEAIEGLDNVPLCGRYVLLALRQPGKKARK